MCVLGRSGVRYVSWLLSLLLFHLWNAHSFGQHRCNVDFHAGTRSRCKKHYTLSQHTTLILLMQSQSSMGGGRVSVLMEEMLGLFTHLFQEGEQGVSSEQRPFGQMAGACEE